MEYINNFKTYTKNNLILVHFKITHVKQFWKINITYYNHTGSGKTLPAEFVIYYYIRIKKRVIYTSPIKALSNQKYKEFKEKYPDIEVGILTGDIKHNPEAQVLIMTTEILQKSLF